MILKFALPTLNFMSWLCLHCLGQVSEGEVGGGGCGWWAHPPTLVSLGKMALGVSVG